MAMVNASVTLSANEIDLFSMTLSAMRHEVNNYGALIVARGELMRLTNVEDRHINLLVEQCEACLGLIAEFHTKFREMLGITSEAPSVSATGLSKLAAVRLSEAHYIPVKLREAPLTLSTAQIDRLHEQFSTMRQAICNHLSLVEAAAELIRQKPDMVRKLSVTLVNEPQNVKDEMNKFSVEFEKTLGILRPG